MKDGTEGWTLGAAFSRLRTFRAGAAGAALDVFAIRIAAAIFAYGAQVMMARLMGRSEYGVFASIWVWIAILGHSSTLGFAQGACRFLPADQARGDAAHMRGFLLVGAWVTIAAASIVAGIGLAIAWMQGILLDGPYAGPLLLAALVLPLFTMQDYLEGVARSQNWAVLAIAPPYLLRQGLIMVTMAGAVTVGAPAQAWVAIACTLVATGLALAIQARLLILRLRDDLLPVKPRYRWRIWLRACLPIAAADLAYSAFSMIDVVILGMLMPPAAVGLYFVATRIQQFVPFVHYAASAATAQRFAAIHASGDADGLTRFVRMQARLTFAATVIVGLFIVTAGPFLLAMFGPEFGASYPLLAVLVAGNVGASLFGPGEDLLTMIDGERLCAGITLAMLALAALLCLILVPVLGIMGAAIAMAMANVLRGLGMAFGRFPCARYRYDGPAVRRSAWLMKTVLQDLRPGRSVSLATYSEMAADPDPWDALMANALTTHPHYSRHVMEAHRRAGLAAADLTFIVVQGRLGLEALLPFAWKRDVSGLGTRIARPFLSPFITQTSPLVADAPDLPDILDLLVKGLQSASKGRIWRWPLLPTETKLGRGLLEAMDRAGWKRGIASRFERPIVERRGSYAGFLDEHPHRSRMKDLSRRHRNLSKRGTLSHDIATGGDRLNDAVAGFLRLEKAGWKGRAGTALASRPQHEAFARALFTGADGPVRVRADSLLLDGRPLSISLALVASGTATLLKTTFEENERSSAPGLLLEARIIEALYGTGFAERLDSATLAGSVLENLYPDRETICEIVAAPSGAARMITVEQRIRLISMERRAMVRVKRALGQALTGGHRHATRPVRHARQEPSACVVRFLPSPELC